MQLFGVLIPEKEQLVATVTDVVKGKAGLTLYASLFGLAIGFYAIAAIFIQGHAHTINTSSLVPWGMQISTYVYHFCRHNYSRGGLLLAYHRDGAHRADVLLSAVTQPEVPHVLDGHLVHLLPDHHHLGIHDLGTAGCVGAEDF